MKNAVDLSGGWYANYDTPGALTLRNSEKGQRVTLTVEETTRLRELMKSGEADKIREGA